jgi:DNA-binding NtrC family response regulator
MTDGSTVEVRGGARGAEPVWLVAVISGRPGPRFLLAAGSATVGRGEGNDLVLEDRTVSTRHVEVELVPGGVRVRDLGSKNKARFQGSEVTDAVLAAGSTLRLGSVDLRIERAGRPEPLRLGPLFSRAPSMRAAIEQLARIAPTDSTVLVEGETGTGKEVTARALHGASGRKDQPFTVVDCSALPRDLAASELFGHVKGAFTGAERDRAGAFELAHRGTLFLDEIGELPLDLQPLLLRALEQREVRRVGEGKYRAVDVRVVAATNRSLEEEVRAGRFRGDLLHRLAVIRVRLPPLRERREDVADLLAWLLEQMGPRARDFAPSPELLAALEEHDWPGNVRELKNFAERAVALAEGGTVDPAALGLPGSTKSTDYRVAREEALNRFERQFVEQLLKETDRNVSRAAKEAGIDRVYLHRLMKKHGL